MTSRRNARATGAILGVLSLGLGALPACGRTEPSGPPILVLDTRAGKSVSSGKLHKEFKDAAINDISSDGRFLVEQYSDDEVIVDKVGTVGPKSIRVAEFRRIRSGSFGDASLTPGGVVALEGNKAGHPRLRVFNRRLEQVRAVKLPGTHFGSVGIGEADHYISPRQVGEAIFLEQTHWKDVGVTSDAVLRIDPDNSIHVLHKNKHLGGLTVSADGRSLLATVDAQAPFYEGAPANKWIVELDPESGRITQRYGLPPSCKRFRRIVDTFACISTLDKVDGVIVAEVLETVGSNEFDAIPTTWTLTDQGWREVKSQRGKHVRWLDADTRIEEAAGQSMGNDHNDVFRIDGTSRTRLGKAGEWTTWQVHGSLIRP